MATLLKADGTKVTVRPKDGHRYTLEELQEYVGGYIELVHLGSRKMWVNEEGKLKGQPVNIAASKLRYGNSGDFIVGDVLVVG